MRFFLTCFTIGGYKCKCKEGFSAVKTNDDNLGDTICVDINECNDKAAEYCGTEDIFNAMRRNKLCQNTPGDYN